MLRVLGASPVFVGGCAIGGAPAPPPPLEQQQQRGRGKRGRNRAPRAPPHCKRQKSLGRSEEKQRTCRGAKGKGGREGAAFFCDRTGEHSEIRLFFKTALLLLLNVCFYALH